MSDAPFGSYPLDDEREMARMIAVGLPVATVNELGAALAMRPSEVGSLLDINEATLECRLQSGARLKPAESERVARLMRVVALATSVLESEINARKWLQHPLKALADKSPLDLTATRPGALKVERVLWQIEHGVFS